MEHRFFLKSEKKQTQIQLCIGLVAFVVVISSIVVSWKTGIYFIGIFLAPVTLTIVAPFIDVPGMKKKGKLIYYSSLFLTEKPENGILKIHGGSLFDYVFVIENKFSGRQRVNLIIQEYLQGLLKLIETFENTDSQELKIRGTSYIINERTAERMGFKVAQTDAIQKLILMYNYFNILIMYSIAKGRLSFPPLGSIITYEADLGDLVKQRASLRSLHEKLKKDYELSS